jgi:hypothetical protein
MGFLKSLESIGVQIGRVADALNYLALEHSTGSGAATYSAEAEPGVYNPTEDEMIGYLQRYDDFHADAVSNPYRGWKVFDDETED